MSTLPLDVILHHILLNYGIAFVDPTVCRAFFVGQCVQRHRAAQKLQRWMRYYRIPSETSQFTKRILIRYYMSHYPRKYLMIYPEFVVRKCRLPAQLLNVVHTNRRRTPHDVRRFLKQPEITPADIFYAGW
jgi:hypothetical protein